MAYYVGTQQFPSVYAAARYLAANPQPGVSITSAPVAPAGMMTGGTMYAGGTPNFDERTGQSKGKSEKKSTKQTTTSKTSSEKTTQKPTSTTTSTSTAQPKSEMTFTFIEGSERGDAKPGELWGQTVEPKQVTESELRDYFNDPKRTNRLPEVFGTFENYLGYMTEREQLLQSGELTLGDWGSAANISSPTETITLEDGTVVEIPAIDIGMSIGGGGELGIGQAGGGGGAYQAGETEVMLQQGAYDDWLNSEVNSALLQKYGVSPVVYSETGDKFQWNGSSYVKTINEDHAGLGDYVKMAMITAVGILSSGALAPALSGGAAAGTAASIGGQVGASVLTNALTQAFTTGSIDFEQLLETAATAGLGAAVSQIVGPAIADKINLDISNITGIEQVDNVLEAMGQTAIRQAVFDGELDMDQIVSSGLFAGAKEIAGFLLDGIVGQQEISEEKQKELEQRYAEYAAIVDEDTMEEVNRVMGNTVNEAIAAQQNEAMANQLQALSGNLQSIYEEAYAPTREIPEDLTVSTVDAADSELADTTADLIADTTVETEPMRSIMYVDDTAIPADRVGEILDGSEVVTTLDGSGDYQYGSMELGDTYLAYHTQHVDESGIEYTLIRGSNGRLYVSDGTNLVEYQGASDLTHNGAQVSWLDSHLVSGGGLPTDANNARFLDVTLDVEGAGAESASQRIFENMEAGWQDVNNPTLESSMAQEAPDTPLDLEVEVDPFEYEEEPELTPEPPPEPEPEIEPVEQQEQEQAPGEAGTASPSPDPTRQDQPSFAPAPTPAPTPAPEPSPQPAPAPALAPAPMPAPAPAPAPARTPQEEAPITTGMFEEYFPAPAPAPMPAPAPAPAPPPAAPPAPAPAPAPSASAPPPPAPGTATSTTPESSAPATTGVGTGSGTGAPAGETYEQGSLIGDARALIEQALLNGATPEYLQENFPQYSDIITEVSSQLGTVPTQQPSVTAEDVEGIVSRAVEAIPEGMTPEQVSGVVNEAIGNIEFPEGMTASEVSGIVDEAIASIQFPEGLSTEDVENIVENAIFGIDFPESATMEEVNEAIAGAGFATSEAVEAGQAAATEERRNLQQAIISAQGDIEALDANTRQQFEEFGGTVNELFSDVNVDIEALQAGQISQAEAQQAFQQSTEEQFGELGSQVGELGTQLGGLASDVSGIGRGLEGLGEGVAGLGAGLGMGLLSLGQQQQQLAAQLAKPEPIPFDPFLKGLSPFQPLTPIALAPQKQTDAMSELNKFLGRQTGMLV